MIKQYSFLPKINSQFFPYQLLEIKSIQLLKPKTDSSFFSYPKFIRFTESEAGNQVGSTFTFWVSLTTFMLFTWLISWHVFTFEPPKYSTCLFPYPRWSIINPIIRVIHLKPKSDHVISQANLHCLLIPPKMIAKHAILACTSLNEFTNCFPSLALLPATFPCLPWLHKH